MAGSAISDVAILSNQKRTHEEAEEDLETRLGAQSEILIWAFSRAGQKGVAWALDEGGEAEANGVVEWKVGNDGGIARVSR